jgi:predicted DNA-binding WGR domain protein
MKEYLEFVGQDASRGTKDSKKFWEVEVKGKSVYVRYGRIGTDGVTTIKKFSTVSGAEDFASKAVAEKIKKGYQEAASSELKIFVEFHLGIVEEDPSDEHKLTNEERKERITSGWVFDVLESKSQESTLTLILGGTKRIVLSPTSVENRLDGDYDDDREFRVILHFVEAYSSIPSIHKAEFLSLNSGNNQYSDDSKIGFELKVGKHKFKSWYFELID